MELTEIVERYAEALESVDRLPHPPRSNQRTGNAYRQGIKSLTEPQVVTSVDSCWAAAHPEDFSERQAIRVGVRYPTMKTVTKCDHVFSTDDSGPEPEWAIEWKNAQLVGDNGKGNDFTVSKVLSPYLKDRSILHDVLRLRTYPLARRHAVVGYGFGYNLQTCEEARSLFPGEGDRISHLEDACRGNGGELSLRPLLDFAESILYVRGLIPGPRTQRAFTAWAHPCGGHGIVFGWEVRRPELELGFDERHPW